MKAGLALLVSLALASASRAEQTTLGDGDTYAWGANFGWIQLAPERPTAGDGVRVADTHLSGYGWSDSTGWIHFGDGTPADQIRYANTDGADFGVNHDGAGNLSGLAWSANLGWINFGWAASNDANRPRFDLQSGNFTGYAWSANAGWINLGSGLLKTDSIAVTDSDVDGISDTWERELAGNLPTLGAATDVDKDGTPDVEEYLADTDPLDPFDRLRVLSLAPETGSTQVVWTSRATRLYRLYDSADLGIWNASTLGIIAPDAGSSTSRSTPHADGPRRFFMVEAFLPLP